ncbi:unnamed protein product [Fraxinus pennsylvanica]|uniref:F-box protein n=1 Tax=Fraxinus pennsylvanica TaxID=56036 RepID=A0AAD1ZYN8_9LAMI|nr:unnamed protein product [Fraxinus pennsylvanica]
MSELNDDLVLEVISWLPLKDAVRCKILDKNFNRQWEESHEEDFVCKSSKFVARNIQPVYLHDSLHWLREDGSILSFDIEKRRAGIFQGPVKLIFGTWYGYDIWFGGVEDSLVLVCPSKYETVIYVYDLVRTKTWQIWHRIGNISRTGNNDYRNVFPILFDGQRLILLLRNKAGEDGQFFMHNILVKSWEKIGTVSAVTEFVPFVSTLAKINSGYVLDELRNNFLLN